MIADRWIRIGFLVAGLVNVGGVLVFSKAFTNETLNGIDPVVMSNFGLVMIMLWGLAYIAVANRHREARWLVGVFALEKLAYSVHWLLWFRHEAPPLGDIFGQDPLAGAFYSIYGANDFVFMVFFAWVFLRSRK